jgi:hypothetical protein
MKKEELTLYRDLLGDIKTRVRQGQHRAALSANAEMLFTYWDIGRMIAGRQKEEGWGAGVIPRLAADLKNELPEEMGFSDRNLKRMIQFWAAYPDIFAIGPPPVAQLGGDNAEAILQRTIAKLSWTQNIILIQKIKDLPIRYWYARQALQEGWSRDTLTAQIKNRAHERQGAAITNFATTLPEAHAAIAQGLLKDPNPSMRAK